MTIAEATHFLDEMLTHQRQLCDFEHTDQGGKRCPQANFGCLHSLSQSPIAAIEAMQTAGIINFRERLALYAEYYPLNQAFRKMDAPLHVAVENESGHDDLKKVAHQARERLFAFIWKIRRMLEDTEPATSLE